MSKNYLPEGMPIPVPQEDGLDKNYWEATRRGKLMVQKCGACGTWQWGPEWICHNCHSFNMTWEQIEPSGRIYSWERPWHPVHPALRDQEPYIVVLVELPQAANVRMIGNLLGDPHQKVMIGSKVEAVFEPHDNTEPPYTLVQWRVVAE